MTTSVSTQQNPAQKSTAPKASKGDQAQAAPAKSREKPVSMVGSAARASDPTVLYVVPDIAERVAKFRQVKMPFQSAGLSARDIKMVNKLVDACQYLEAIFWRQSDPDALALYHSLDGTKNRRDQRARRYMWINGARFDLLKDHKPFIGRQPMLPGRGFYPPDLTREKVEEYVKAHPEKKAEIYSPTTVVRWNGGELEGVPYHIAYRRWLEPAAKALREAADFSADKPFAAFLRLRADALLTDDYLQSDLAWVDLKDPRFDIIYAPYETYLDGLLGVKGSYGASVLVRNEAESRKLAMFQKYVPDIQDALPLPAADRPSKRGLQTPMEVMEAPFRSGDLTHGYQAVADNLPNDPRVHEQKGSKKIFFRNFMDARVNYVILPVAKIMMRADQAAKATGEGYLVTTIMHEICHGLGPAFARTSRGKADIREAIGPVFGGLEEAKADVVGMYGLKWLVDHGVLPKEKMEEYYASQVAGIFRTVRFGVAEAHGRAEMMEFNYLSEKGAIFRDNSGKYVIDYAKIADGYAALAKELLEMEATGDRLMAENWFGKYGPMPDQLKRDLTETSDIPVDVDPVFSFPGRVR